MSSEPAQRVLNALTGKPVGAPGTTRNERPMNKFLITATVATLAVFSTVAANAASTSSAIGAEIVSAIVISNTVGLDFGQIAPTIAIGSVTVATDGARSKSGGV